MHNPELLFLDEPTSGLDPVNARIIKDIITRLKQHGTTIFLTTHNMHDAEELCDRLALIDKGTLLLEGSPTDLKLQYGEKKLKVTLKHNSLRREIMFDLKGIGSDSSFIETLKTEEIETIHTCEANLEDIFIKVTGHTLGGLKSESFEEC